MLSDRPEDWRQLVTVTALVRELGGRVDSTTGQHVHLSTADFAGSAELYTSLIRTAAEYEDLLYRLGAPDVSHHRGILHQAQTEPYYYARSIVALVEQCFRRSPHPTLAEIKAAFQTGEQDSYHSAGHYFGLNLEHVVEGGGILRTDLGNGSRIELRTPNGTLDAAQIQTNVRLAAALVSAARNAVTGGVVTDNPLAARAVGWHQARGSAAGDTTFLLQLLDRTSLPDEACRALFDTFLRSRWQPVERLDPLSSNRARAEYDTLGGSSEVPQP